MKPWEEIWSLELFQTGTPVPAGISIVERGDGPARITDVITFNNLAPPTLARAKLATQAPAMARLILSEFKDGWENPEVERVLREAGVIE